MSPTPTIRPRAARLVALLSAGALALGGLTALDASSAPPRLGVRLPRCPHDR